MERIKYIPGDWVSVYVGIKKYIVKVIGIKTENEVFLYQIKFPNGEIQYANKDNIVPIPLAPEILKENGWAKDKERSFKTQLYYKKKFGVRVMFVIAREEDSIVIYNEEQLRIIKYIHELQHILFGLELNSDMNL